MTLPLSNEKREKNEIESYCIIKYHKSLEEHSLEACARILLPIDRTNAVLFFKYLPFVVWISQKLGREDLLIS